MTAQGAEKEREANWSLIHTLFIPYYLLIAYYKPAFYT